jgi:hypothetical protein
MVTMYAPPADPPDPVSTAVTTVPEVPLGTRKVHDQVPVPLVLKEPAVHSPTRIETVSNVSVAELETVNPAPETVTELCTGPCPGVTVIAGMVTMYVPPADPPDPVSTAVTTVPEVPLGTRKVHDQVPVPLVLSDPGEQDVTETESNVSVTELETVNPVPETVTALPAGPCEGATAIDGVVTRNDEDAAVVEVAVSVAPTLYEPAEMLGTLKVHENDPLPSV